MHDAVVRLLAGDGEATAFAVHPDGWFLTCDHSIADTGEVQVMLSHNRREIYDAEVVLRCPEADVAVLRVREGGPFASCEVADHAETGRHAHLLAHFTLDRIGKMTAWAPTGYRNVEVWWVMPSLVEILACPSDDEGRALLTYHSPDHVETGCSGAPITQVHGETVLGMHTSEFYRGMGLAVRATELNEALKAAGVSSRAWKGRPGKRTRTDVAVRARDRYDAEWLSITYTANVNLDRIDAEDARKRLDYLAKSGQDGLDYPSMHTLKGYLYYGIGDYDRAYESGMMAFDKASSLRAAYLLKCVAQRGVRAEEVVAAMRSRIEKSAAERSYSSSVRLCCFAGELLDLLWRLGRPQEMVDISEDLLPHFEMGDRDMTVRCLRSRALCSVGRFEEAVEGFEQMWSGRADGAEGPDFVAFTKALASTTGNEVRAVRLGMWATSWAQAPRGLFVHAAEAASALGLDQMAAMLTQRALVARDDDADILDRAL